ncbi:4'-phosphopantetheinyl transferase superfamily protein [Flavobacteriales bacterium]|nr:4'-phosphopantetheinyl transferase superfamily protein [Flavobacteriales bacterium]
MPLLIKKEENNNTVLVWEISEHMEKLISLSSNTNCSHLKSEKRKKEFLACRILLNYFNKDLKISYSANGSPKLNNSQFISISHSNDLVCIIISDNNVGIDIELISEKTLRTSSKFTEKINLTKEEITLIWCIKEAVFKFHKIGNIDFKKDISVPEFTLKDSGKMDISFKNNTLKSYYFKVEKYYLAYVCK